MKKLYPRICSNCGSRFLGKRMAPRCLTCVYNLNVKVERSDGVSIETRGRAVIGAHAAGYNRSI